MKKSAIVLILGLLAAAFATCLIAFAAPPPPGPPPHEGAFFGGPPGPPPGPPPHGGGFFGGPPGPPPHGRPLLGLLDGPPDLIEKLKLTDDQLKQMRLVAVDSQNKTRKARTALMGLHDEKKTMLVSGKIDQTKLAKLDEEIVLLSSEVMGESLKMKRDQLSKLTPEQVERMATFPGKREIAHEPKLSGK